jgi:UDP-glucose 6-dehydrogenase
VVISVFGMGYVGLVSAACLLREGHYVVGVEVADSKAKDVPDDCMVGGVPGRLIKREGA